MARRVFKYEVGPGEGLVELPVGATVLHVATQPNIRGEGVYLWALVDPTAETTLREIGYFATGQDIPDRAEYIGTAVSGDRAFVWHVFEWSVPF